MKRLRNYHSDGMMALYERICFVVCFLTYAIDTLCFIELLITPFNVLVKLFWCVLSLTLKVSEKLQLNGLHVYYVVHICDYGMLRVNALIMR